MRILCLGLLLLMPQALFGASCCGGSSSAGLTLSKFQKQMVDLSFSNDAYDGYWNKQSEVKEDPAGSSLKQMRWNLGYAHRLGSRWQTSLVLPYVYNDNAYSGFDTESKGLGDTTLSLTYEHFDGIQCVYKYTGPKDLIPALYLGLDLTIPTGVSAHDDVDHSFDVTGRGFYRIEPRVTLEKSIYPWTATLNLRWGTHIERSVNREYNRNVQPYKRKLGDRTTLSLNVSRTQVLGKYGELTAGLTLTEIREGEEEIDGREDANTGFMKRTWAFGLNWSSPSRKWLLRMSYATSPKDSSWGENFPITNTTSLGASYVLK